MFTHNYLRQSSNVLEGDGRFNYSGGGSFNTHTNRKRSHRPCNILLHHLQQQPLQQHHQHGHHQKQPHHHVVLNTCFVNPVDNSRTSNSCVSFGNSKIRTLPQTMPAAKIYPHAVLLLACILGLASVCVYRVYLVMHRTFPADLAEWEKIRWLDECGRLAFKGNSWLRDYVGMDAGTEPIKTFINTAFSLLFNPLPAQRLVYRNIRASQDVYAGVPVSTYTPVHPPTTPTSNKNRNKMMYPTIIYFHGGGWTWLSVGVYDGPLKHLANSTNFKVIAVEYRKAPEHPFPAPFEDCLAVTKYVWRHAKELHIQQDAIIVAGDGAGGNLAAAVAHEMAGQIRMQILISPALQMLNFATPSYQDYSEHLMPGITSPAKEVNNWVRYANIDPKYKKYILSNTHVSLQHYRTLSDHIDSRKRIPPSLSNVTQRATKHNLNFEPSLPERLITLVLDSRFSPMFRSDIRNSPQAYIMTAHYDVLRDEALMYGQRLKENGVTVELRHYWNGFHGFFLFAGGGWMELEESKKAMNDLVIYLNRHILNIETRVDS